MGRRLTRKQMKQDEFASFFDAAAGWLSGYWRAIVVGIAAIGVVGLIWWGATAWSGSRVDEASYVLHEAVRTYLESPSGDPDATPGAADLTAAEAKLREVVDRYGRTDQADVARLYLARVHLERNETEEARELLAQLSRTRGGDALGRVATLDLVHLRIAAGQGAEVATELEEMVTGRNPRLPRDAALFELASLYVKERQHERAREYFQRLVEEFPESPYLVTAQQRLQELS